MELAILDKNLPVKAYPEEKLNEVILMHFTPWLAGLLSLTGETSIERLKIALPAIKEHCWSLGFDEIVKMFQMYADNKLNIEPIPNYFDRILFGKIAAAYKQQRPVKKPNIVIPEISEGDKLIREQQGVLRCYDEYQETFIVDYGYSWVYDWLDEKKLLNISVGDKRHEMVIARKQEKSKVDRTKVGYKNVIEMIEDKNSQRVINQAKRNLLKKFFDTKDRETFKKLIH
jgi:hypothetical protein